MFLVHPVFKRAHEKHYKWNNFKTNLNNFKAIQQSSKTDQLFGRTLNYDLIGFQELHEQPG